MAISTNIYTCIYQIHSFDNTWKFACELLFPISYLQGCSLNVFTIKKWPWKLHTYICTFIIIFPSFLCMYVHARPFIRHYINHYGFQMLLASFLSTPSFFTCSLTLQRHPSVRHNWSSIALTQWWIARHLDTLPKMSARRPH